jgi:hypothetical protein
MILSSPNGEVGGIVLSMSSREFAAAFMFSSATNGPATILPSGRTTLLIMLNEDAPSVANIGSVFLDAVQRATGVPPVIA